MAYALAEADLRGVLPHIDVPTLLLYGEADQRSSLTVARELHARIPCSTLTVLPGLGHECYLESPDTFSAEVLNFLAGCRT
jgi:pimeloyl-ACP methyl ester carboxylesterase